MKIHPTPIIPADRRIWHLTKTCGRKPHQCVVGWCADGKVMHWRPKFAYYGAIEARL